MTDEMSYGDSMEDDVRKIAARLGVADFVYTVPILSKEAGGSREVGDALLISNGRDGAQESNQRNKRFSQKTRHKDPVIPVSMSRDFCKG
jgi:hypothetical protein